MTDIELLKRVKTGLGISGDYQDEILQVYIDSVKEFMKDAGVPAAVARSEISVGCILIGVNDLWNYSSGGVKFSEFFKQRVIQLSKVVIEDPLMSLVLDVPTDEEAALFGWHNATVGLAINLPADTFTVNDEQSIKCVADLADGTELTAEDDSTGNRRRIKFTASDYVIVMPDTVFDITQSKFVDSPGATCINVRPAFNGGKLSFETFYKTE